MAYNKKYMGDEEVVKEYLDGREDRIEREFNVVMPEFGSNTNGSYVKLPDGTLMCYKYEERENVATTVPMGSLYREEDYYIWNFPHNFIGYPIVSIEPVSGMGNGKYISGLYYNRVDYRHTSTESVTRTVKFNYFAIGRWK